LLELKTLFGIARLKEKCYTAEVLYEMYSDDKNLAYLRCLKPILEEVQIVNKSFESNYADPCKLLSDLTNLVKSTVRKIVTPMCREDFLTVRIEDYLNPKSYLGYSFEKTVEDSNIKPQSEKLLRDRCVSFILHLGKQLQQRLPHNINILENISLLSVSNSLKVVKNTLRRAAHQRNYKHETFYMQSVSETSFTLICILKKLKQ